MIVDYLDNFRVYQRSVPELWDAIRFVERVKKENLPVGKYPVGKAFAFVQEGTTRTFEEGKFETHNQYLDIQILLEGEEMWEYTDKSNLEVDICYDPQTDIEFLKGTGSKIQMKPGMFYVVYPWDGHKPCCHEDAPTQYKKIVVKVKIDKLIHGFGQCQ